MNTTLETCPVCQTPDVKVEHMRASVNGWHDGPVHEWHCPECGDSTAVVLYDCPHCPLEKRSNA